MEYFNYHNDLELVKGCILISEPFLPDSNFERTVILLCEHNEEGSFGFVLNKPTEIFVKDVLKGELELEKKLYIGGPVQHDSFHFLHKDPSLEGAVQVRDDLFWGGNFEQLKLKATAGDIKAAEYKFLLGYSGWSDGQLEDELKAKSWIIAHDIDTSIVVSEDSGEMWKKVLNQLGGRFSLYASYPVDPRLN